jgi:hypothetical protein
MEASLQPLALIFGLNDRLFHNALHGVSEEQAKERVSGHNNPLHWIAAHTVSARYLTLMFLGKPETNPFGELFSNFKAYDPSLTYPTLAESKAEWDNVTKKLKAAFESATAEQLAGESVLKSPIGNETNAGTLAFLAQHESYDIGQMAFLKKYATQQAMAYS